MERHRRVAEVETLLRRITGWAQGRDDVRAVALVGSWARGVPRPESDVDVIVLTDVPERYTADDGWVAEVGGIRVVARRDCGAIAEHRFVLPSGLEVELGVGAPSWASAQPLDAGTQRVVADGMRILHDPDGHLAALRLA